MRRAGVKRMAGISAALLAALVLMAGSAAAQCSGKGAGGAAQCSQMGPGQEGVREGMGMMFAGLGLSEDQQKKIQEIREGKRADHLRLQKEMRQLENALEGEMLKDNPSTATLRELAGKIGAIRTQEMIMRLEGQLAVRGILTAEQRDRMLAMPGGPCGRGLEFGCGPAEGCGDGGGCCGHDCGHDCGHGEGKQMCAPGCPQMGAGPQPGCMMQGQRGCPGNAGAAGNPSCHGAGPTTPESDEEEDDD
jgi:Spy/CpxP family protein refolding chaperone